EGSLARSLGEEGGQFNALSFSAGERGGRLPQSKVAESYIIENAQPVGYSRQIREEGHRLSHGQLEHFVDVLVPVFDIQERTLEARALALFAYQFDIGQKLHLDCDRTVTLTGLTAA